MKREILKIQEKKRMNKNKCKKKSSQTQRVMKIFKAIQNSLPKSVSMHSAIQDQRLIISQLIISPPLHLLEEDKRMQNNRLQDQLDQEEMSKKYCEMLLGSGIIFFHHQQLINTCFACFCFIHLNPLLLHLKTTTKYRSYHILIFTNILI